MEDKRSEIFNKIDNESKLTGPHGWIQWKGTDVCIDLHCTCGHHGHIDAEFFYYYRCSNCKQVYGVGQHVKLVPLTKEQAEHVEKESSIIEDNDNDI